MAAGLEYKYYVIFSSKLAARILERNIQLKTQQEQGEGQEGLRRREGWCGGMSALRQLVEKGLA